MKMRFLVPVAGFLALAVFLGIGLTRDPTLVPSPLIGKAIPEFTLPRLAAPDRVITDKDIKGKFALVNVWATWCTGCRQEHETLIWIANENIVPIYGLNWKDESTLAKQWLQQLGNPYTATAVDAEGRVAIDWGVYGAPETFLINPNGIILYRHISPMTREIWETEFLPLINKEAGS